MCLTGRYTPADPQDRESFRRRANRFVVDLGYDPEPRRSWDWMPLSPPRYCASLDEWRQRAGLLVGPARETRSPRKGEGR